LAAHAEESAIEQAHRARQHALACDALPCKVPGDAAAHAGQCAGEGDHFVELALVGPLAPLVVVAVLLAPAGVDAGGLDVSHRLGADPDFLPRGWDRKSGDPLDHLRVRDPVAVLVYVLEALAAPPPAQPGTRAVDVS